MVPEYSEKGNTKMGLIDNLMNVMRLNPEDEDDGYMDEEYDDDEPEEKEKPARKGLFGRSKKEDEYEEPEPEPVPRRVVPEKTTAAPARPSAKITSISHPNKKGAGAGMEVCVFKPTSVEDAREITETLLLGRTVLLNVEGLNLDVAQRIIDFVSGATFAIAGNLQKVSNFIFVLTPKGVDISGDYQDMMGFDISGSRKNL